MLIWKCHGGHFSLGLNVLIVLPKTHKFSEFWVPHAFTFRNKHFMKNGVLRSISDQLVLDGEQWKKVDVLLTPLNILIYNDFNFLILIFKIKLKKVEVIVYQYIQMM